ncbi:MAG TPA: hypothetical protein GX497_16620 [Bacillus bacterium]|nr:hypothetical protein [Bacillus sp. (in: firmicutes)]
MTALNTKYFINLIWDRWDEGVTQIYSGQKQIENFFLQAINQQKNTTELYFKLLDSYAKECKELTEKFQAKAYSTVEKYQEESKNESLQNIHTQLEDVIERISKISLTPQNALKQWMSQNLSQIEKSIDELFQQQEKNRSELKTMISEISKEMKNVVEKMTEEFEKVQNQNLSLLK